MLILVDSNPSVHQCPQLVKENRSVSEETESLRKSGLYHTVEVETPKVLCRPLHVVGLLAARVSPHGTFLGKKRELAEAMKQ